MEVGVIEDTQSSRVADLGAEVDSLINSSEVFTYAHENGLTVSATIEDMGRCAVLGAFPPEMRAVLAEGYVRGREIQAEKETHKSEEAEEAEPKEKAKNQDSDPEQGAEVQEPKKVGDDTLQQNRSTKQEGQKVEQPQALSNSKQETAAVDVISNNEVADGVSSGGIAAQPSETNKTPSFEGVITAIPLQEAQQAGSPGAVEALSAGSEGGYLVRSKDSEPATTTSAEASVALHAAAENQPVLDATTSSGEGYYLAESKDSYAGIAATVKRAVIVQAHAQSAAGQAPKPFEVGAIAAQGLEDLVVSQTGQEFQTNELYLEQEREVETGADDTGAETEDEQVDDAFEPQLQTNEQQPSDELAEIGVSEKRVSKDYIIPAQEAQTLNISEYIEDASEAISGFSVPIEEVEQIILQAADNIEAMEVEEATTAHKILDELVQKTAEAQSPLQPGSKILEVAMETADAEEELKELFIQLFDHIEISYTPELIESCVKLALQGNMSELMAEIEQRDEEIRVAQGSGTHEVIKQLLSTISSVKRSVQHAYQIGKSALRLYSQKLPASDLKRSPAYEMARY
jgi:hypothetical protein